MGTSTGLGGEDGGTELPLPTLQALLSQLFVLVAMRAVPGMKTPVPPLRSCPDDTIAAIGFHVLPLAQVGAQALLRSCPVLACLAVGCVLEAKALLSTGVILG